MDETPYEQKDLLSAEEVARYFGVGQITVYRWCKEGRLRCIKLGKHWRIRREALEDFLSQHERPSTLVGLLSSFLEVPDNVLAIAQNIDILHRLDAASFQRGAARGGRPVQSPAGGPRRRRHPRRHRPAPRGRLCAGGRGGRGAAGEVPRRGDPLRRGAARRTTEERP